MVDVKPFRAWRYNAKHVRPEVVVAPPYDVIDDREQDRLYAKNPHNVIRLILTKDSVAEDTGESDKYRRAAAYLSRWQKSDVLEQDQKSAFYLYRQTYPHLQTGAPVKRVGLFATIKLEDFSKKAILPHERTHAAPKVDRMNLIRAVKGNLSPVFGLYEDRKHELDAVFNERMKSKPALDFKDDQGVRHEMWLIEDESSIQKISAFFKSQSVMIADGHHRYETALAYRDFVRQNAKSPDVGQIQKKGQPSSDFVMMALVNMYDDGLLVFPTHRLVKLKALPPIERVEKELAPYFSIRKFDGLDSAAWQKELDREPKDRVVIGLQWGKSKAFLLTLKDPKRLRECMPAGKPDAWYRLDVNIVAHVILSHLLGITPEHFEESLEYTRVLEEAVKAAGQGGVAVSVLLRAPDVATVKEVCYSGEVMPQKSTYFYPKLPSGLLFHLHERENEHGN